MRKITNTQENIIRLMSGSWELWKLVKPHGEYRFALFHKVLPDKEFSATNHYIFKKSIHALETNGFIKIRLFEPCELLKFAYDYLKLKPINATMLQK